MDMHPPSFDVARIRQDFPILARPVHGRPLVFHHFTGFDSGAHYLMRDKYGKDMPAALELSRWYTEHCQSHADEKLESIAWAYGAYDTGETILPAHRQLYRQREDLRAAFADPFSTQAEGPHRTSYYHWLKNQGLFNQNFIAAVEGKPFRQFWQETRAQLLYYLLETHRLPASIKRPLHGLLRRLFDWSERVCTFVKKRTLA